MQVRNYDPNSGDFPQGDICIFPIPESVKLSERAVEIEPVNGRLIIQEGEVTGHHHAIAVDRKRHFRPETQVVGDPTVSVRSPKLRQALGGKKAADVGTARLFSDPSAVSDLMRAGELTRADLAIGILVVEGGPVVLGHEEHDGIRIPNAWTDAAGTARSGRYYIGRQVESAGAEERVVSD